MHKKILTVLSVITCLLLTKSNANDIEPTKEFYTAIRKGTAPMVIDGTLNEWTGVPVLSDPRFAIPKGAGTGGVIQSTPGCNNCSNDQASPNYVLWEALGGTWSGPDDQTSAVEVVWDENNVYLGFIVTDDYHENQSGNAWNGDSVQLMIAPEARSNTWTPGVTGFLYNFALLGVEGDAAEVRIEKEVPPTGVDPEIEAVVRRDVAANKTYYEIRLSAAALNLTPPLTAGLKFGLGMSINDGDELEPGQKGWGGLGAHSIVHGKHPSETALVTLSSDTPGTDVVFLSAVNSGITSFTFRVNDKGTSISDPNSVKLTINGQVVQTTKTAKADGVFDVTYTPASPFAPGSQNTYAIEVKDTAGAIVADSGAFATPQYGLLTAADKVTPDTTKRGFMFTVHQNAAFTANSFARASAQLAGSLGPNLADPAAQGPALAPATPNSEADTNKPYTFEIEGVINMNIDLLVAAGNDLNDTQVPGAPGLDLTGAGTGLNDGIAADILTFVELTAGMHTLIVNSDDGFKTFTGKINDVLDRTTAGEFDNPGGRGAADTAFQVYAPETGVYALRTVWHQGGGGGNIEILEQLANGTKVLLNDDANGGPKTYRAATGPTVSGSTVVSSVTPSPGATGVNGGAAISATIIEGTDAVDLNTVKLRVDGNLVNATPTKTGNTITISYTPPTALSSDANHTAGLDFTAGGVARAETWSFKTTLFGPGTLFIEAEDFNFDKGQYVTGQPIGMDGPYPGGAYQDKGTGYVLIPDPVDPDNIPPTNASAVCSGFDWGVDYNDNNVHDDEANNTHIYRPGTTVEAAKRNGPAGFNRGTFNVSVNHVLGWTSGAEWMNYTRDFPTANPGTYHVYARMAHGDVNQRRGGILMTVQGNTALCANGNQTTTELGRFSAPWTGGWDTWPEAGTDQDAIIPMKDATGAKIIVKLQGKQTLRFQYAEGSGDIDFLAFVPVNEPVPPKIASIYPSANAVGLGATPSFRATLENGTAATIASATLKLDGTTVASTFTTTANGATVNFTPTAAMAVGSSHVYLLSYTDSLGVVREATINFSISHTPFPNGTLFIEAEDFNFEHGKWDTVNKIGMNGAYPGGTYQGKGDGISTATVVTAPCDGHDWGIDYNDNGTSDQAVYRPNTPVEAGKFNGPAGLNRQTFDVQVNHVVGWTGTDEWMNYTRDFPAPTTYKVYARMAHENAQRGGILFKLTGGDPTLCDDQQVFEELGRFSAVATGGWDTWPDAGTEADALIPMKDANGADAVITLGGRQTIRFQFADSAGDLDYLAFLPQGPAGPQFTGITRNANGSITVTWEGTNVVLESTTALVPNATWTTVPNATSPFTFTPQAGVNILFARLRQASP